MNELTAVGILLAAVVAALLAFAPRISESLVRSRARRLPRTLSARMAEEWRAELGALPGGPSQLAFAIALTLTRRHSFAVEGESVLAAPDRSPFTVATFCGWRSVVVFTTVVVAAIAYAASFLISPLYQSRAVVLVVPPRVASRVVESRVHTALAARLSAVSEIVLSRMRLEDIILQFDLYSSASGLRTGERDLDTKGRDLPILNRPRTSDAAIERMRNQISVDVHPNGQSFEVAFVSPDPQVAMNVTARLTSLFIETSLRDREDVSQVAGKFLDVQIEDVRSRLLDRSGITSPTDPSEADVRAVEHESLKTTYRDLLRKKEHALIATRMEQRLIGEQFRLLDPARLPQAPISPDRPRLTLLGAVVGFSLGMAMMLAGRTGPFRRQKKVLAQS